MRRAQHAQPGGQQLWAPSDAEDDESDASVPDCTQCASPVPAFGGGGRGGGGRLGVSAAEENPMTIWSMREPVVEVARGAVHWDDGM